MKHNVMFEFHKKNLNSRYTFRYGESLFLRVFEIPIITIINLSPPNIQLDPKKEKVFNRYM